MLKHKYLLLFPVISLLAAVPQGGDPPEPNGKCCQPARVLLGGSVPSALCSRTDCLPNTAPHGIASCGGLIAADAVVNAKCEIKVGAYCLESAMIGKNHSSNQIHCDFLDCTPTGGGTGSKCVVTPAPTEPQVVMPYNECAKNFTKC